MNGADSGRPINRRDFMKWGSLTGVALIVGVDVRGRIVVPSAAHHTSPELAPSQWLRIDTSGAVTIVVARSEMGQGVRTALPMIVADELGADWSRVSIAQARPGPDFPDTMTSGSGSVIAAWNPLRRAGAAAREMLVAAAAAQWGVDPSTCTTKQGSVLHRPTERRLGFGALVEAASKLAVPASPSLRPAGEYTLIGTAVPRVDAPAIVAGSAVYGLDVRRPGMKFAAVARAPRFGGRVRRWSGTSAMAIPGVHRVVQISNGVAVVADRTWAAFRGRDALDVEWNEPAGARVDSDALRREMDAALAPERGRRSRLEGDPDAAMAGAARRLEATYRSSFQAHAAMEPLNCVADVRDGRCEIWVGSQGPQRIVDAAAKLLGIDPSRVTVNVPLLGGGFGRRIDATYVMEAVELSRAVGGPVQVVWTREDDVRHDMYEPAQTHRVQVGLDAEGRPTVWRHRAVDYALTMYGSLDPGYNPASDGEPWGLYDFPYAVPALDVTLALLREPMPTGAWRSVSYPASVFARETMLDEVARATGRDPLALRLALIPSPGMVRAGASSLPNGDRLRHVLTLVADRAGWSQPMPAHADGRRWGRGLACNSFHDGTLVAQVAEVSVGSAGDLRVHRVVCAIDAGRVINRSGLEAQVEGGIIWGLCTVHGQVTFRDGACEQSNFTDFPVVRMDAAPTIEVHVVDSDLRPFGAGECAVPPVVPAVLNAVFAATGKRVRQFPVSPADLAG